MSKEQDYTENYDPRGIYKQAQTDRGALGVGVANVAQEVKLSQVVRELSVQEKEIAILAECVEMLAQRLFLVLRNEPGVTSDKGKDVGQEMVPLADMLYRSNVKIAAIRSVVQSLTNRLEI